MHHSYTRNPRITERKVEDEIFLVNPESDELYHLNATGAVLWRLFAEPTSAEDALTILCEAFPDVSRDRIEADVSELIGDLVEHDLLRRNKM